MENNTCSGSGGDFFAGAAVAGIFAWAHNTAKNERHQQELQEEYSQGYWAGIEENKQSLLSKDIEIASLRASVRMRDQEIARLKAVVENQSDIIQKQQLQSLERLFLNDDKRSNSALN